MILEVGRKFRRHIRHGKDIVDDLGSFISYRGTLKGALVRT